MTAAELDAQLQANPEFVERQQERERIRLERSARLGVAEEPLVQALNAIGFDITSVWDFVNTRRRYDAALPILAVHLERDYPPEILEGIARAMAVQEAMSWREDFIRLIRNRPPMLDGKRNGFRDGLALAIGNTTGPHNVWETIELLRDRSIGESRILMLSVLGKVKEPEVREALLELRENDPELRRAISDLGWVKKLDRERKQPV
ncbi:MAG: hypothetical protein HYX62_09805 [Gammaproteobacteria bacterium]|nr:hypothetical protein [Gammaproteobacteria bacterium]